MNLIMPPRPGAAGSPPDDDAGVNAGLDAAGIAASIERVEMDLLLEALYRVYALDLRGVRRAPLDAAVRRMVVERGLRSVTALLEEVLHGGDGPHGLAALLCEIDLFADPDFFTAFREHVIPWLRTYPYSSIWAAESATGAEVYALAILLEEAGLSERVRIYATQRDASRLALLDAGMASPLAVAFGERSYREAGGTRTLADYYERRGSGLQLHRALRRNIVWAQYDLRAGESFNEFDLILCRNVLPGLSAAEQRRAYRLVAESLSRCGLLALGEGEKPDVVPYADWFRPWRSSGALHQRVR
jgi:chemotaxis protein methyltransferase CheR